MRRRYRWPRGRAWLLDHLVGAREDRRRDRQPERLRGLEVDHQLEPGAGSRLRTCLRPNSLLTGKFTGSFAPQKPSCADQTARKCPPIGHFSPLEACMAQNPAENFRARIRELSGVIRESAVRIKERSPAWVCSSLSGWLTEGSNRVFAPYRPLGPRDRRQQREPRHPLFYRWDKRRAGRAVRRHFRRSGTEHVGSPWRWRAECLCLAPSSCHASRVGLT